MEKIEQLHHVEDVGRLLLETQKQLQVMREQMTAAARTVEANALPMRQSAVVTNAEVQAFNAILQQTELELKAKAELVLNGMISSGSSAHSNQSHRDYLFPAVSVAATPLINYQSEDRRAHKSRLTDCMDASSSSMEFFRKQFCNSKVEIRQSLKPSHEHWQHTPIAHRGHLMRKKTSQHCRLLPSVVKADPSEPTPELGEEDAKCGLLNLVTRGFLPAYADLTPAFAGFNGTRNGTGGGAVKLCATHFHERSEHSTRVIPLTQSTGYNLAALKFDFRPPSRATPPATTTIPIQHNIRASSMTQGLNRVTLSIPKSDGAEKIDVSAHRRSVEFAALGAVTNQSDEIKENSNRVFEYLNDEEGLEDDLKVKDEGADLKESGANFVEVRGCNNDLSDAYSLHQFLIYKGRALRETPEFISFRRVARDLWGSVEEILRALERLFTQYSVSSAHVDGERLLALAATNQPQFTKLELLSCIVNNEQVMSVLRRPGQRYKGRGRKRYAATTIQACVRMWMTRHRYAKSRVSDANATRIQLAWRAYSCCLAYKARSREARREKAERWEAQMFHLKSQWSQIAARRRVVVHVPSLSLDEHSRVSFENFAVQQNLQLTRVCAAALDSHVDLLVYVSPFELTADVSQYFFKLLQLGSRGDSRPCVKFVYPEQAARFPAHFSLSSLLLYSPHCLRRIRRYTAGKEAYLVMGLPGAEDQQLAMTLNLPILGALPAQALPLLTRSGGKRLFIRADINVPTGSYELYNEHEICTTLAKLAVAHIDQPRWLIKLDYDPLGLGEAVVDLSGLKAVRDMHREKRSLEYWRQIGSRDAAANLILTELKRPGKLARLATIMHTELFPTWQEYVAAIGHFGCVIEATPPTANVTLIEEKTAPVEPSYVRANVFVDPDGSVHMTSTQNVLATASGGLSRKSLVFTFPQTAAPHEAIKGACKAAGKRLAETNVWGHVSLDFVVFRDNKSNGAARLWALAVYPFLTDSAASFACFHLLVRGGWDANSGIYRVTGTNNLKTVVSERPSDSCDTTDLLLREASLVKGLFNGASRCYVVCSYMFHPNVTTMQYTAFFHTCRLHGVCFDVEQASGTLFLLADSLTAGVFGILSIGETTEGALAFFQRALEVIGRVAGGANIDLALSPSRSVVGNFAHVLSTVRACNGGGRSKRLGQMRKF